MSDPLASRRTALRTGCALCFSGLLLALLFPQAEAAAPTPGKTPAALAVPRAVFTLRGHKLGVFHVAFSPDGRLLATSSKDRTLKLWDAATGKEVRTLTGHENAVYSSAFSPDGRLLASAGEDQSVRLWDVASGREVRAFRGHTGDVYHAAFSPDGRTLASAGQDRTARLWDVATGKLLHTLKGHSDRVVTVAFRPDGTVLASACGTGEGGGEVKLWDVAFGKELFTVPGRGVLTVAFSPDGKRLAGSSIKRTVQLWEAVNGQETLTFRGHSRSAYHVAFSPDGRRLASCSGAWNEDRGGEVKLWDLRTGRELLSFKAHATPIWSVAFSPDSDRLASASGKWSKGEPGEVTVWQLPERARPRPMPAPPPARRDLEALWDDLAGADAARAYRAVWALSATPRQTVPYLLEQARAPAAAVDPERVARLLADLDNNAFAVREGASRELSKLGRAAYPALRRALRSPSPEVRRRAGLLLDPKGAPPALTADELRALRVIEVLQHIGTADVRPVLRKLAGGAPESCVTREAAAALGCRDRRDGAGP